MGLPKPLGPLTVAFGDFELRRIEETSHPYDVPHAPLFRLFYPTSSPAPSRFRNIDSRSWLLGLRYTYGTCCALLAPTSFVRRFFIWLLACMINVIWWPWSTIHANVATPILQPSEENEDYRFPVVIFSHGLWACRTTYSGLCCDLASHGYVVVAVEHLDGSANMARYTDNNGKINWVPHFLGEVPANKPASENSSRQLRQRVAEIQEVVNVLENLDGGLLTQGSNTETGKTKLNVGSLLHRLDFKHLVVAGHSFGGATAVAAADIDERFKCCVGLDVWWEPLEEVELAISAFKSPVLLLNTEAFSWKALDEAQKSFVNVRMMNSTEEEPLVTEIATIKGTTHQNQSDFPLLLTGVSKIMGFSGKLKPQLAKDINSRVFLQFLQLHLFLPGTYSPCQVDIVETDKEHLSMGLRRPDIV